MLVVVPGPRDTSPSSSSKTGKRPVGRAAACVRTACSGAARMWQHAAWPHTARRAARKPSWAGQPSLLLRPAPPRPVLLSAVASDLDRIKSSAAPLSLAPVKFPRASTMRPTYLH